MDPGLQKVVHTSLLFSLQVDDFKVFKSNCDSFKRTYEGDFDINHVNDEDQISMTYLDIACQNGQADFVAYLLAQGADPNRINQGHKCGPIHFAIRGGYINVVKILLSEPTINLNLEASGRLTALHLAVQRNDLICAGLLLGNGADPNIPFSGGVTPIHWAAMKSQENMVKLILEKSKLRIDLDSFKDYNHQTTRHVLQEKLPSISLLQFQKESEKRIPSSELQRLYKDLLHYLEVNDFTAFKNLFDNSTRECREILDIDHVHDGDQLGMTYLDNACRNGRTDFVAYLLARGADPNRINQIHECGPIHFAIRGGYMNVLKILLKETTINPNLGASGQHSALHLAVQKDDMECAELLLGNGADPNIPNNEGVTPIHLAAMTGQENMVKLIFEKSKVKIDLDSFMDYDGQTTRQVLQRNLPDMLLSRSRKKSEYVSVLVGHDLENETLLVEAPTTLRSIGLRKLYKVLLGYLQTDDFKVFKNIFDNAKLKYERIFDINHVNGRIGMTYLDIACQNGKADFVAYLLAQGADPNKFNQVYKCGPIHFATRKGYTNVLKMLLNEPPINPNLEASGQLTALYLAVQRNDLECAELLLNKDANPNLPNNEGLTPIHLAAIKGQENIVNLIFEKSKVKIDLDSFKDFNGLTSRQVLQYKMPNLSLPPYQDDTEVDIHYLRYYLNIRDQVKFLITLPKVKIDQDMVIELLKIAVRADLCESVSVLLDKHTKKNLDGLVEVARIAVLRGHQESLKELFQFDPSLANSLIMDACKQLGMPEIYIDKNLLANRLQGLKLILMQDNVNLRCEDEKGNTPLHHVAKSRCQEAIELLLEKGCYIGHMNKSHKPPIAEIPPGTLSKYLNNCVSMKKKDETNEYLIEFNYQCLMPHNRALSIDERDNIKSFNNSESTETKIMSYIADHKDLKHLLKHPLFSSFLYLKWHGIQTVLYMNSILSVMFYLLMNAYIFVITDKNHSDTNNILYTATVVALICISFREILQFLSSPFYYMFSFSNWLDIVSITLSTLLLFDDFLGLRPVIILVSNWQLISSIGDYPEISTGIVMFKRVSWTFIKFTFPYVICIFAFALAFFTLFENDSFKSLELSIFKTIIMLSGELGASELSFTTSGRYIFVIFVFFMTIILMNLLSGLAVSDTAVILKKAELVSLVSRTKLIAYVENIAAGAPFFGGPRSFCCINLGCKPFSFFVRRILLFPHLQNGKLCIPLNNNSKSNAFHDIIYRCLSHFNRVKMDKKIVQTARALLFREDEEEECNPFSLDLERLYKKLASIETNFNQHVLRNNNCKVH